MAPMATESSTAHNGTANPLTDKSLATLESVALNHASSREFLATPAGRISDNVLLITEDNVPFHLTQATLAHPSGIGRNPVVVNDDEAGRLLAFYHLGDRIAGHVGIVHGGVSATLLDECMGRASFPRLAGKIGVTAKLELQYRAPIPSGTFVLVRATTTKVEGRKAWVEGVIEDATDGKVFVEATALFIEPKWAASMAPMLPETSS